MKTIQEKMKDKLSQSGLPFKEIKVYGSQIVVTSWSQDAAMKWAALLGKFSKVRGTVRSQDYVRDTGNNTQFIKKMVPVCRTFATIAP